MNAISLFSGAGGLDIGLNMAGIKTRASIEIDEYCALTLRKNFKSKVFHGDVRQFNPKEVLNSLALSSIDLIHGGPPCQPFSQIGAQKGLHHKDGALVFEMLRWIKELKPRLFVIEQVKGFFRHKILFDQLLNEFSSLGYGVSFRIVNSSNFGVAQERERLIITGSCEGTPYLPLLEKQANKIKTVGDVISDLPVPNSDSFANHIDVTPMRDRERISFVKEGEWLAKSDAPANIIIKLTKKDTTKFRRLAMNLPSLTLRCGEIFYHPKENRYLTPREYLRIHGYPDNFVLYGPVRSRSGQVRNLDQHRQVANSVPPPLAFAIGKSLLKASTCQ